MILWLLASTAFGMTLDEAWHTAETRGVDVAMVREQAAAAETVRGQVLSTMLPHVQANGSFTLNQYETSLDLSQLAPGLQIPGASGPIVINAKDYWSGSATVNQPLFSASALPALAGARATAQAAADTERDDLASIRLGVAQAFWTVVVARERDRIAEESERRAEQTEAMVQRRADVGSAQPTDLLQAKIAVTTGKRDVARAQAARTAAEQALARLLGIDPATALDRPALRTVPYASVQDAVARVDEAPGVVAAEARARAAHDEHAATALGWIPDVGVRFTEAYSQNTGFTGKEWQWQAAVVADWSLFDGGYRIAKERETAAEDAVAAHAAERERAQAEADVRSLWQRLQAAKVARSLANEQVALAKQDEQVATRAYAAGDLTFLELETAREGRDAAELQVLSADEDLDLAVLSLLARTGDLGSGIAPG